MRRRTPTPSTKNLQLYRLGIIDRDYRNNTVVIDIDKLLRMEDSEILKCPGVGNFRLAQINRAREELKRFLFENIK